MNYKKKNCYEDRESYDFNDIGLLKKFSKYKNFSFYAEFF